MRTCLRSRPRCSPCGCPALLLDRSAGRATVLEETQTFGSPDHSPDAWSSTSVQRGAGMVAEGLSFMRDDANIPSEPSAERLIAARIGHGDSPHTVRALRADLRELCVFLARQGLTPVTCGSEPLRRWQASLAARRLAPATIARHLSSARALFGDLVRRGERADDPSLVLAGPRRARRLPGPVTAADCATLLVVGWNERPLSHLDRARLELLYG